MEPQIGQNATKTPSKMHSFFAPFFSRHFSHVVPDLALGPTFVHFWLILGPPGLHFGLILFRFGLISVPFFAPNASILGPYGARNLGASISGTPLCFVFWSLFDPC